MEVLTANINIVKTGRNFPDHCFEDFKFSAELNETDIQKLRGIKKMMGESNGYIQSMSIGNRKRNFSLRNPDGSLYSAEVVPTLHYNGILYFMFEDGDIILDSSADTNSLLDGKKEECKDKLWRVELSVERAGAITISAPTEEAAREAAGFSYNKEETDSWDDRNLNWFIENIEEVEE